MVKIGQSAAKALRIVVRRDTGQVQRLGVSRRPFASDRQAEMGSLY